MEKLDLTKPEYFYNRELSWLKFNLRVLKEAMVKETPLLERLKFIAISACLLYTSPSPRDLSTSRMPSSA